MPDNLGRFAKSVNDVIEFIDQNKDAKKQYGTDNCTCVLNVADNYKDWALKDYVTLATNKYSVIYFDKVLDIAIAAPAVDEKGAPTPDAVSAQSALNALKPKGMDLEKYQNLIADVYQNNFQAILNARKEARIMITESFLKDVKEFNITRLDRPQLTKLAERYETLDAFAGVFEVIRYADVLVKDKVTGLRHPSETALLARAAISNLTPEITDFQNSTNEKDKAIYEKYKNDPDARFKMTRERVFDVEFETRAARNKLIEAFKNRGPGITGRFNLSNFDTAWTKGIQQDVGSLDQQAALAVLTKHGVTAIDDSRTLDPVSQRNLRLVKKASLTLVA